MLQVSQNSALCCILHLLKFNTNTISSVDIYFFFAKGDCRGHKEITEGLCRFLHYPYDDSIDLQNWEKLDLYEPDWIGTNSWCSAFGVILRHNIQYICWGVLLIIMFMCLCYCIYYFYVLGCIKLGKNTRGKEKKL